LEALLASQADAKSSKTPVFKENYILDRNKTNEKKPRKKSAGRKPAVAKIDQITDTIDRPAITARFADPNRQLHAGKNVGRNQGPAPEPPRFSRYNSGVQSVVLGYFLIEGLFSFLDSGGDLIQDRSFSDWINDN